MPASLDSPDPLAILLAPPPNESPASRIERLRAEAEARRASEQIDEELRRERSEQRKWEKEKRTVKVLLLGQSESGKSTTIKSEPCHFMSRIGQQSSVWLNLHMVQTSKWHTHRIRSPRNSLLGELSSI